jgi:hypothetical protein
VDLGEAITFKCLECSKMTNIFVRRFGEEGGICGDCFLKREERRDGCICYNTKGIHLCPICDEIHARPLLCGECLKKQTVSYQRKKTFFKVILPTALISLIIGFFLG